MTIINFLLWSLAVFIVFFVGSALFVGVRRAQTEARIEDRMRELDSIDKNLARIIEKNKLEDYTD